MEKSTRPGWTLGLQVDTTKGVRLAVFLRIAHAIADAIREGRLPPGKRLPGARTLAAELGVHRHTVIAAYDELVAQGWLRTDKTRGTFVETDPDTRPRTGRVRPRGTRQGLELAPWPVAAKDLERPAPSPTDCIAVDGGTPDLTLVPAAALARAYRRALTHTPNLGYGDVCGHPRLRSALAAMLVERRGLAIGADEVLVTRGSQGALDLVARAWVRPGDRVAVEALGYGPARGVFTLAGAEVVPVALDAAGLDVDALIAAHEHAPLRAIYVTPHHQYPTTVALAPWRRERLMRFASAARVAVIEDDYDHEFHYRGRPLLPLKANDTAGVVVYIGTLSKLLAPGLRVGYAVAPPLLHERMVQVRTLVDRQGDPALEAALAELFEDGEVQRHARRARLIYEERREVAIAALESELGAVVRVMPSHGGMALWVEVVAKAAAQRLDTWLDRAEVLGVKVQRAHELTATGPAPAAFRMGFARVGIEPLKVAVARLRAAHDDVVGRHMGTRKQRHTR